MKARFNQCLILFCVFATNLQFAAAVEPTHLDDAAIASAVGTTAAVQSDGVVRVGWQRNELPVTVAGIKLPPQAGLGSWAAFKALPGGGVMVMGDTVVFEDEITPAMDAAFDHGLEVTALHNHFVFDRPSVYFMHIGGKGKSSSELARAVKATWDAIKEIRHENPMPADRFSREVPEITGEYDVEALNTVLGASGNISCKVLKFTFGRSATMRGVPFGASMGLSTWAAFSGNSQQAVVDGDFAMKAAEVQPVMYALRKAGIHIVALHNHMVGEMPPYYFLHYWGNGDPMKLAQGIRSALDIQQESSR